MKAPCGFLRAHLPWFEDNTDTMTRSEFSNFWIRDSQDSPSQTKDFTLYYDTNTMKMEYSEDFRTFWVKGIQPVYPNGNLPPHLIGFYDMKSNPRRIHPYAHVISAWYDRVIQFLNGEEQYPPVCVLKKALLPLHLCFSYRQLEKKTDPVPFCQYKYQDHDALLFLIRIQVWWRESIRKRKMKKD